MIAIGYSYRVESELTITIKNTAPVDLLDLTASFVGIADEYRHHIAKNHPEISAADVRLYVKEIRAGSIVAELVAISPQLIQGASYINSVVSFGKHMKAAYEYLEGLTTIKPNDLDKAGYQNLSKILNPIVNDNGSQINIGSVHGDLYVNVDSKGAAVAKRAIERDLSLIGEKESRLHEKVLLYLSQAKADPHSKTGDKGVIESIHDGPVKIVFKNDLIKAKMVLNNENPFKEAFVVDVVVGTINQKPALYNVMEVYEVIQKPEE